MEAQPDSMTAARKAIPVCRMFIVIRFDAMRKWCVLSK
ncbi:hypothetical protein LT85_1588 [Collimonas arenae]|uniref:Uncharacterized protein n=1 Tax=Collimonas arenae TaxID=279058 RepID=A0A0A1F8E7_9BURK|nr:hypothetical protein LT85_1588 [Collimonas arenae]